MKKLIRSGLFMTEHIRIHSQLGLRTVRLAAEIFCRLFDINWLFQDVIVTCGIAKGKKEAKRRCAEAMVLKVSDLPPAPPLHLQPQFQMQMRGHMIMIYNNDNIIIVIIIIIIENK